MRTILTAPEAALQNSNVPYLVMVELDFDNETLETDAVERNTVSGAYVLKKSFTVTRSGPLIISFDLKGVGGSGYGQIKKNGVNVGVEESDSTGAYVTKIQTIAGWNVGDICELWIKAATSATASEKNWSVILYGTVRLTNAGYDFDWNGHTWTGAGNLGGISAIEEGTDLQMYGVTLTLSGIQSQYIAECFGTTYSGRSATIWLAPLDANYQILADPIVVFKGKMDTMPIKLGKEAAIQVTVESDLVQWERGKSRVFGNADQQSEYPTDKGFEFVAQMVEQEIYWGRPYNT
jgi:hypothetical protein